MDIQDTGLFIGLNSLPLGNQETYEQNIAKLFSKCKQDIKNNFDDEDNNQEFSKLYEPRAYYVFGKYDLATLALIDDFDFPTRKFKPYIQSAHNENSLPFDSPFIYQTSVGILSSKSDYKILHNQVTNVKNFEYPLIGISNIKLSNSFLLNLGTEGINTLIEYINKTIINIGTSNFIAIFLYSYSWHELKIVYFANSFSEILRSSSTISTITGNDLINNISSSVGNELIARKYNNLKHMPKERSLIKKINTILGFDFRLIADMNNSSFDTNKTIARRILLENLSDKDYIIPECEWICKAGMMKKAISHIKSCEIKTGEVNRKFTINAGKDDITWTPFLISQSELDKRNKTKVKIGDFIDPFTQILSNSKLLSIFTNINTSISLEIEDYSSLIEDLPKETDEGIKASEQIDKLLEININTFNDISKRLKDNSVSKVVRDKYVKLLLLYNNLGVQDKDSYLMYSELLPILTYFNNIIKTGKISSIHPDNLEKIIDNIYLAFNQRFHLSNSSDEISDYNIYFNGAIHQLLAAYYGFFSIISTNFGNPYSIIYIKGNPDIATDLLSIRLNYLHIFHPGLLLSVGFAETSNNLLETFKLFGEKRTDQFIDIFGLTKTKMLDLDLENYSIKNEEIKELAGSLNEILFQHVFSDLITLKVAYFENFEIFLFWIWGAFLSSPGNYIPYSCRINKRKFLFAYLRCIIVAYISNRKQDEVDQFLQNNFPGSINNFVKKYSKDLSCLIEILKEFPDDVFPMWCEAINEFGNKKKIEFDINFVNSIEHESFRSGDLMKYNYPLTSNQNHMQTVIHLLFTYQRLLKKEFDKFKQSGKSKKIYDRENGKKLGREYSDLMFDPLGGIFTKNPQIRRKYFKYRNIFYINLWNLSLSFKRSILYENKSSD